MAVITGATTTTSLVELVMSEEISRIIIDANRAPTVAEAMARTVDASGFSSATWTAPKWTAAAVPLSESSAKSETDEFAATEQLATETQVIAAMVGIRKAISEEVIQDGIVDLVGALVRENVLELRDQVDEDWLSNITSASTTANYSGLDLTVARFGSALATFRAQNPHGTALGFVGSNTQVEDLKADLRSTTGAIFGGAMGSQAAGMLDARARGFVDMYEGVSIFATDNVPAYDGSNDAGALMSLGMNGPIALVVWTPISLKVDEQVTRLATDLVTYSRYGTGIVDQSSLLEVASANS